MLSSKYSDLNNDELKSKLKNKKIEMDTFASKQSYKQPTNCRKNMFSVYIRLKT